MEGAAVYLDERGPAQLAYELSCDKEWRSRQGHVQGWIGPDSIDFSIVRTTEGAWTVNDQEAKRLENCVDLDFGFTPATNLILLHRLALREGESADAPAAWLNVSTGALELLPQRYERRSEETYWYEAPSVGYAALFEITPAGFIRLYPNLWVAEP